jgi:hypothetical protein
MKPMKTSAGDLRKSTRSATGWRKGVCAMAAIAMLALTGNGMAQSLFPWTGGYGYDNTKPIPGHPCHNKYHEIRQGSLYVQQNNIAAELDKTGSMPEGVTPSPAQCKILRALNASHDALIKSYTDEQACVARTGEPVLPELKVRLDDRYWRKGKTESFLRLCPH